MFPERAGFGESPWIDNAKDCDKAAACLSVHPQSSLENHPTLTSCELKRYAKSRGTQIDIVIVRATARVLVVCHWFLAR